MYSRPPSCDEGSGSVWLLGATVGNPFGSHTIPRPSASLVCNKLSTGRLSVIIPLSHSSICSVLEWEEECYLTDTLNDPNNQTPTPVSHLCDLGQDLSKMPH